MHLLYKLISSKLTSKDGEKSVTVSTSLPPRFLFLSSLSFHSSLPASPVLAFGPSSPLPSVSLSFPPLSPHNALHLPHSSSLLPSYPLRFPVNINYMPSSSTYVVPRLHSYLVSLYPVYRVLSNFVNSPLK